MRDRQFLRIDDKWALAYDHYQWVLQKRSGIRRTGRRAGQENWEGVCFITSTKAMLAYHMRRWGVPDEAAATALAQLPDTFSEFLRERNAHSEASEALPSPKKASGGIGVPPNHLAP